MSISLSVRLPDKLVHELENIAAETERSKTFHMQKALESYLEYYSDLQIALDRVNDKTDQTISRKSMKKALGI